MELISQNISDCKGLINLKPLNVVACKDSLTEIQNCIQNIKNTNTFMIMAINRCLDYTKASKGLKLVPHYETIPLIETIELPLNCIHNIIHDQDENNCHLNVKLLPIDTNEICGYTITDKQWLQENILCLLSNAVKYSTSGTITLRISLMETPLELYLKHEKDQRESAVGLNNNSSIRSTPRNQEDYHQSVSRGRKGSVAGRLLHHISKIFPIEASKSSSSSSSRLSLDFARFTLKDSLVINTRSSAVAPSSPFLPAKLLKFEVEDMGIGISDDAMESLFQPFKQAQRLTGGTGLGLYSLAKRVEAMHGLYGVSKRHDGQKGSLFWFAIPYRPDSLAVPLYEQDETTHHSSPSYSHSNSHSKSESQKRASRDPILRKNDFSITINCSPESKGPDEGLEIDLEQGKVAKSIDFHELNGNTIANSMKVLIPQVQLQPPYSTDLGCSSPVLSEANLALSSSGSPSVALSPSPSNYLKPKQRSLNILIVDDSPSILKMSGMLLKKQGHIIQTAQNGEIALQCLETYRKQNNGNSFDFILMDLQMPVMDGLEATRRIRQMEKDNENSNIVEDGQDDRLDLRVRRKGKSKPSIRFLTVENNKDPVIPDDPTVTVSYSIPVTPSSVVRDHKPVASSPTSCHTVNTVCSALKLQTSTAPTATVSQQPHQFIIGVSANSDHDTTQAAFAAGVDDFMGKPFSMELFNSTVSNLLNGGSCFHSPTANQSNQAPSSPTVRRI
jgi:CheY-like chemotaxis protein